MRFLPGGCSLDCSFCATGKQGFNSNLTVAEIIGQVWLARQQLDGFDAAAQRRISNVVMMGMGEPLMNFEPVMDAVSLMMDDWAYGLSKRKVTISTSGVVPAIRRMKEFTDASLAVSLHAPNDALRSSIMPINKKYPIVELIDAVKEYMASLQDKRVPVIEYTVIKGVNDHRQHARELAKLLKTLPCKINLIPFNPFSLSDYRRSSDSVISNFREILQHAGFTVTVRTTRADDIGAACGQLVGDVEDQTRRQERHARRAEVRQNEASEHSGQSRVERARILASTGKAAAPTHAFWSHKPCSALSSTTSFGLPDTFRASCRNWLMTLPYTHNPLSGFSRIRRATAENDRCQLKCHQKLPQKSRLPVAPLKSVRLRPARCSVLPGCSKT